MNISSIKYNSQDQSSLQVTTDMGIMTCPWPCDTYHADAINAWLAVSGNVIAPYLSLADMQANAWDAIKAQRMACQAGGALVDGNWYQTDTDSRVQYLALKDSGRDQMAAGGKTTDAIVINGQPVQWKTCANVFVPVTVQLAFDIVAGVKTLDAIAFANAEALREGMLASTEPASFNILTGWPAGYQAS